MRYLAVGIFLLVVVAIESANGQRPLPPGIRDGDRAVQNGEQVEPPRGLPAKRIDPTLLKSEAAQLQSLADALPTQVDQITKGMLPKDMGDNLKKIEKLAKHLRSEVTP
ncbi:MAG: hypothetical protein WA755_20280 [Candidatus Acidiferrales bacterium]